MFWNWFKRIEEKINNMATTLAQLDSAIASNTAAVTQVVSDVQALLAKIASSPAAPDFTPEVTSLQGSLSALQGADASTQAVLNPPATPAS